MAHILITYEFEFQDKGKSIYPLHLDRDTVSLISEKKRPFPPWTRLEYYQCSVCPLTTDITPYCPIAANIADLIEDFKDIQSTEHVRITVHTEERSYVKEVRAQKGLSSIFGIIMATSNCPHLDFLKPMARYHLPFSTDEETIIRSISMYLLSQYFALKKRGQANLSLENLERAYSLVQKVNQGICKRISSVIRDRKSQGDAANNAVVILDIFSQLLKMEIENDLNSITTLFEFLPSGNK
jgi:hypothetical protein